MTSRNDMNQNVECSVRNCEAGKDYGQPHPASRHKERLTYLHVNSLFSALNIPHLMSPVNG